jgi:putative transcriptional regulator
MPTLADPNFFQTVTYISEHNASGALGLVINRPLELSPWVKLMEHLQIVTDQRLRYRGIAGLPRRPGPAGAGFRHAQPARPLGRDPAVTEHIGITTSRDILHALARGEGPEHLLVALGYAGWGPGQLEQEMAENAWLSVPPIPTFCFTGPATSAGWPPPPCWGST